MRNRPSTTPPPRPAPRLLGRARPSQPEEPDEEAVPTFTVGELNGKVRDALRRSFVDEVWVRGEVQNLKRHGSGHTYFTLVEKGVRGDRPVARLDVALFRDDARTVDRRLKAVPGAELGNDVEVRIRGRVTLYPEQGRYQLVMSDIDPVFTVGGIAANRERVLRALAAEGLIGHNARHVIPPVPLRAGLVTSVGSAAYHDFVHELELSGYALQVAVVDVRVQGSAAARRIKYGLNLLAGLAVDAVVLVRGGGSRDLMPFDTDIVARAVAEMPVPVLTGVGHEIDRSVADEVAHTAQDPHGLRADPRRAGAPLRRRTGGGGQGRVGAGAPAGLARPTRARRRRPPRPAFGAGGDHPRASARRPPSRSGRRACPAAHG
ncbi:MAG: exodeoxyribonuclease VII large subunit [Acidimicrobiia bacterium]